jgi:hypothetical protein
MLTVFHQMGFYVIGFFHEFESASQMTGLTTAFLTTVMPQASRLLF